MIDLTVKTLDSLNHSFSLEDDITVRGFKEQIAESVGVPAESQRLIYCGRVLQDYKKLIEYDVNGKVIHLVQRAPPQSGQRGNTSGQGQDQNRGQDQSQGPGGNSHRPHFRHARAQVRLPRMDRNAMYLGAMSFPADIGAQGVSRPRLCSTQSMNRLALAQEMVTETNRVLNLLDNPDRPAQFPADFYLPSRQQQPQDTEQEQEQGNEQGQSQDQEQLQNDGDFEIQGGANGGGGLAQAASAAINAALSAAGLNNVAALSTAALSSLTLLGGQSDGSNPTVIHARIQRNNVDGGESVSTSNPNDINQSEQSQPAEQQQQQQEPPQQQQQQQQQEQEQQQQQQPQQQQQQQPRQSTSRPDNRELFVLRGMRRQRAQANVNDRPPTRKLGQMIGSTVECHRRLIPYLERYRDLLLRDQVFPIEGEPNSLEEAQRIANGASEALHNLAHAAHALSDIIVDFSLPPPRALYCRPRVVQHSPLLQAGIPIQVEAHISVHGRNQNINNNNDNGGTAAPANGAASTATESGRNADATNGAQNTNNAQQRSDNATQQQQQQQPQQQQPNFGALFNVPHNVEVLMEVGPELGGNEQAQQNPNNGNNNNGNPGRISAGIFPWGASPPPDFMHNLMQMVAGQMARGVATVTTSNAQPAGEQPVTNTDGTAPAPASTVEGSTSNAGQSTQARGNTGTHPTTSTQTRSTPRPHVFHSTAYSPLSTSVGDTPSFDPFLRCNSHHLPENRPTDYTSMPAPGQQQRANRTSAATSENQTATSTPPLSTSTPRRENNASAESATSAPPQQANNVPISNRLAQILTGVPQSGGIQTSPGRWMQLFTGVPAVQNLLANGSNPAGSGMTLIDLLENTPGLGVPTNIGIVGPLRMDQALQGEDLLFNIVVTVVQNITLDGWEALRAGHWEPLAEIRRPLRQFFLNIYVDSFASTTLSGFAERIVDRLIGELQPTLNQLLLDDTNARDGPEMEVDIPATIESLLRRHFLNILRLLFDTDVDENQFAQGLLASIKTLQTEACSVLQYSFRGRQLRVDTVAQRIVTRLTEGVEPALRQWIVNSCVLHVCSYLAHMTQLPDNEVVPLLVLRTTPGSAPTVPLVQQRVVPQTQSETESMETDAAEASVDAEPLDAEATFFRHEELPSDWVPIIARDDVRQRRQMQAQMQCQGMTENGVGGFSDAYLGGMPSKRRKLIEQQKPRILLSPTPNHSSISMSIERLVSESVRRSGVTEVEGAAAAVTGDPGVRRAFGQAIRGCLYQHPQRETAPDFPDPLRFPNATKYFAKRDESSEK